MSKTDTDLENEPSVAGGEGWGEGESGMDMFTHTAVFKMDNQQGLIVQHREPCSQLCGSLDGSGV